MKRSTSREKPRYPCGEVNSQYRGATLPLIQDTIQLARSPAWQYDGPLGSLSEPNYPLEDVLTFRPVLLLIVSVCQQVSATEFPQHVVSVIEENCLPCHNSDESNGDVDFSSLLPPRSLDKDAASELWSRVEKMVAAGKMPPEDATPLDDGTRDNLLKWYRETYVLRDGKQQVGVTTLRRLTRYELQNTLEQLLHIKLKQPYVFSSESAALTPSTIEKLYPADVAGESGFDNDAEQLRNVRVPVLEYLNCLDFALRIFDQDAMARERVLGSSDKSRKVEPARARQILTAFSHRASRGFQNAAELDRILSVCENNSRDGVSYAALRQAIKGALLSPSFLYRMEIVRDDANPYQVNARELAVRLSYFLWSSMPDDELLAVGADESLLQESVLREQVQRMLESPKRIALSENFAGQWLGFDELKRNPVYYRGESWTRGVYDELLFSFDELIKSDRSMLELIDADWVYLRSEARRTGGKKHQLDEKFGDIFGQRRVRTGLKLERFYRPPELYYVSGDRIGGVITSAGIMRLTSAPKRTSPIRRGVWLLERIIGQEMQPPVNVPPLAASEKKLADEPATGVVEILKLHTAKAACQTCHQHIDPLGLGLENFSPIGDWRTTYDNKTAISAGGTLPNGERFDSPKQMKRELLSVYREQIVENVVQRMLSYAIGRKLRPYDRVAVERIKKVLAENDNRLIVCIEQIILSKPFRCRQDKP